MQFIPEDAYQYLHLMAGMGIPISGSNDVGESAWADYINVYNQQYSSSVTGLANTNFYLVLAFPQGDFADKIDVHPKHDMMVPASGIVAPILGVFRDERVATSKMDADTESVHLMYKLRINGGDDLRKFLEFMADNNMLDKIGGN